MSDQVKLPSSLNLIGCLQNNDERLVYDGNRLWDR